MMQFDWTTFVLEILNFLVLMWILRHFLYRPVLALLDARRQHIQDEKLSAEQIRTEAEALRKQYQSQLDGWSKKQETGRQQLEEELNQARVAGLENLAKSLDEEETRLRARNEALTAVHEAGLIRAAAVTAYSQAAALLQRLASPQLTHAIVGIFLEDLADLPAAEQAVLHKAASSLTADSATKIISAHSLDTAQRAAIGQALSTATGYELQYTFQEDPALIAGLCVVIGECRLDANIAGELAFFRRSADHV